jgi:copper homeostasis protein
MKWHRANRWGGRAKMTVALLEVCVESFEDAACAVAAGASRIEYCAALALGGLTPSPGALARMRDIKAPCMVMIRPRPGDFQYSQSEIETMKREIAIARDHGAAGVVFGVADAHGALDADAMRELIAESSGLQTTLHRVFDEVPDQMAALEQAIELGFDRILTSGGALDAHEGVAQIAKLVAAANGRIGILPGAGISADNADEILRVSGAEELHASCKMKNTGTRHDPSRVCVDPDRVRALCTMPLYVKGLIFPSRAQ